MLSPTISPPRWAKKSAGASGIFNGQVNTGCSYDPYTGNATRSITDIAVAGAVGEYPLALVRTANSRAPSTTEVLVGPGVGTTITIGSWRTRQHETVTIFPLHSIQSSFRTDGWKPLRASLGIPVAFKGRGWERTVGGRARTSSANGPENNNVVTYLILPDGGKVKFQATQYNSNGQFLLQVPRRRPFMIRTG